MAGTGGIKWWAVGYALATQSRFPRARVQGDYRVYPDLLKILEPGDWDRLRTPSASQRTIDAAKAYTGDEVERRLDEALSARPDKAEVCILDLRPAALASSTAVFPSTFRRIADYLHGRQENGSLKGHILIIFPKLDEVEDIHALRFRTMATTAPSLLSLVDATGLVVSNNFTEVGEQSEEVREVLTRRTDSISEDLHELAIRQLGAFPKIDQDGEAESYTRYFYDGRYCQDEIRQLLQERARRCFEEGRTNAIVYDLGPAAWLRGPIMGVVTQLERDKRYDSVKAVSLEELQTSDGAALADVRTVLAVVPMYDRGDSFSAIVEGIQALDGDHEMHGLAVFRASNSTDPERIITKTFGNEEIRVEYLMAVPQKKIIEQEFDFSYYRTDASCGERFLPLTSRDFWELVEGKFVEERDPPPSRSMLRKVPDLVHVLDEGGPWLARKIELAIEHKLSGMKPGALSFALVAEEEAAHRLSGVLSRTLNNEPFHIPRDRLRDWEDGSPGGREALEKWREEEEGWLQEISEASSKDFVVIDEFSYSGGTFKGMASLLAELNANVRLVIVLAAFSRKALPATDDPPVVPLYTTEWQVDEARDRVEVPNDGS